VIQKVTDNIQLSLSSPSHMFFAGHQYPRGMRVELKLMGIS